MKSILTILLSFQICFALGQSFNVSTNDISLDIKELIKPATKIELTHAVKYKSEIYCFFKEVKKGNSRRDIKFCFVFSDSGKDLKKIEVPKEIQNTSYFDLFVKNDSVFAKTDMESESFYFDIEKSKWIKTKNVDDLIFEDEIFYVYSLDFGEWGGKTWFKDKKTEIEYAIEATTPLINKIDTTYFLTSELKVLKIKNPLALNKCTDDITYENIEKDGKYATWHGKPIGYEIVYEDTTSQDYFDFSYRPHIVCSFVWDDELLHIYETETVTFIAKTVNNSMMTIQKIGSNLRFYNWYYSYRSKIQTDGRQLLKFKINGKYGLLEINGQNINFYKLILK